MRVPTTLGGWPVFVTDHAVFDRLRHRIKPLDEFDMVPGWDDRDGWLRKVAELLDVSEPDTLDPIHRVHRLINNNGVPVEYRINRLYNLRFVIKKDEVDDYWLIFTIEEPYVDSSVTHPPQPRHNRGSRRRK